MLAESSDTESERLPAIRTNGRTRTISRLLAPRVVVVTRMTWRVALDSPGGGKRSALRLLPARSAVPPTRLRSAASTRSGTVAKLVSPSSAAKTAPPMRAAPQRPVRIVPLNHWTDTRRRSTRPPVLAVDRQRRLVAEIDLLGLHCSDGMGRAVCPDPRPTSPPPAIAGGSAQRTQRCRTRLDDHRRCKATARHRSLHGLVTSRVRSSCHGG